DGGSCEQQCARLADLLAHLPPAQVEGFQRQVYQRMNEAYRWDLWGAACVLFGGASEETFSYFRQWLILQGRDFFTSVLRDPDSLAERLPADFDPESAQCEELLDVAEVAMERHGQELAYGDWAQEPAEPAGEPWDEDEVESLYPRLASRFSGLIR
ncbi:MAG TPA: DUF4240 domain-containing protein, partial [Candidatus Nitrosotenuis sp.]|nr:DUF4240 domain-containing protein [Candidatus Nitrosotenuis sp.]